MTRVDYEYVQLLNTKPWLASEQCRGFLIAACDNLSVQVRRDRPGLSGRPLALAVARRLYASDRQTLALLDRAAVDGPR